MMKQTRIPDLCYWSAFQPDRCIDFNGFYWRRPEGGVLIDPMPLAAEAVAWLEGQPGAVAWILLTNADHRRSAPALARRLGARVVAPEADREALADLADQWFGEDLPLPEALAAEIDAHWLRGGKTRAEAALYLRPLRAVLFGDAVRSHESGRLRLLPEAKIADRARLVADVLALSDLPVDAVLLGDGDPIFHGAGAAFAELVADLAAGPDGGSRPRGI